MGCSHRAIPVPHGTFSPRARFSVFCTKNHPGVVGVFGSRDVNLLETWQGVRDERAAAWEDATEQVRDEAFDAYRSNGAGLSSGAPRAASALVQDRSHG